MIKNKEVEIFEYYGNRVTINIKQKDDKLDFFIHDKGGWVFDTKNIVVALYVLKDKAIKDLMTNSNAIYSGDKYISLDVKSLKAPAKKGDEYVALTEQEQNELLEYCKKYHEEVKKLSIEELKEQGFNKGDETFISLEGALLGVIEIEKLTEDKAVIWFQSFHTGLGAIMQKYELKYKNGEWKIKALEMAIS